MSAKFEYLAKARLSQILPWGGVGSYFLGKVTCYSGRVGQDAECRNWETDKDGVMKPNEICVNGHEWNLFELNSFPETEKIASLSQAKKSLV